MRSALPNVKVHLDTFHMIREEDDFAGAVLETGGDLGYVHACENQRGIPGTGLMPWAAFFQALQADGLRRLHHHRILRSQHGEHRQALLHLAQAGGFPRATGHRGSALPEERLPAGSGVAR